MDVPLCLPSVLKDVSSVQKLFPSGQMVCEPFGHPSFLDLLNRYAEAALSFKSSSHAIFCDSFSTLTELRAALLGARQAALPILATVLVDAAGEMPSKGNPLCALVIAQSLGAAAFGIHFSCDVHQAAALFARLFAHCKIPLLAQTDYPLSASDLELLFSSGVRLVCGGCIACAEDEQRVQFAAEHFSLSTPSMDKRFLVCNETDVFYLDEDFDISPPLACELDMMDTLLGAESGCFDALCIHLVCNEDAHLFSANQHMARLPVSFLSETEEALEAALLYHNGRALVDARSEISPKKLELLASGYGAVLR